MRRTPLLMALLLPLPALAQSLDLGGLPINRIVISFPVFAQTVGFEYPFSDTAIDIDFQTMAPDRSRYLVEFVPEGETVDDWSEMFTVIGQRDATAGLEGAALTARIDARLDELFSLYQSGCGETVQHRLEFPAPPGLRATRCIFLACIAVLGQAHGEAMVALVGAGSRDLYDLQWARRFPSGPKGFLETPVDEWNRRIAHLVERSRFCDPPEGQASPLPFCPLAADH